MMCSKVLQGGRGRESQAHQSQQRLGQKNEITEDTEVEGEDQGTEVQGLHTQDPDSKKNQTLNKEVMAYGKC